MSSIWELQIWAMREVVVIVLAVFLFQPLHDLSESCWQYIFKKGKNTKFGTGKTYTQFKFIIGSFLITTAMTIINAIIIFNQVINK